MSTRSYLQHRKTSCTCLANHVPTLNKPTRHWDSCVLSVVNPFGDDFLRALYRFCCLYHSGQWSKGYQLLCLTQQYANRWDVDLSGAIDGELSPSAQYLYEYFVEKYERII